MSLALVDREAELARLREAAAHPPSLVIVRGRRRVGKSHLLAAAFDSGRVLSYQADDQPEGLQLGALARELGAVAGMPEAITLPDWDTALRVLRQQGQRPLVVILDEFQHLCASVPWLPSIIQRHWDAWQREGVPITLILSGSAMTFMDGLLTHGSPLFARASYRPLLEPFDFRVAAGFAPRDASAERLIERYGVVGGTPQYQVWAGGRSPERIIVDSILTKGAPLYDEPLQLLAAEHGVRQPRAYLAALAAISAGRTRNSEIGAVIGQHTSNTSKLLGTLAELGYVNQVAPLTPGGTAARAHWRITDPYFRFWFRYIHRDRSRLERGAADQVWRDIRGDLDTHMGPIFEDCCRTWFERYSDLEEARQARTTGRWWSRRGGDMPDAEIDVVAMDRRRYMFLGSCKWSRHGVAVSVLDQLLAHRSLLGPLATGARLAIFARRGFSAELVERAAQEGVLLVTADQLFDRRGRDATLPGPRPVGEGHINRRGGAGR